jgi:acetoacetate decarboxylase
MTSYDPGSLSVPAPEDAVGTPIDRPLTGLPPALFRDGEILAFEYATDPRAIRALTGFHWRADSRLAGGRVLHDYLESSR